MSGALDAERLTCSALRGRRRALRTPASERSLSPVIQASRALLASGLWQVLLATRTEPSRRRGITPFLGPGGLLRRARPAASPPSDGGPAVLALPTDPRDLNRYDAVYAFSAGAPARLGRPAAADVTVPARGRLLAESSQVGGVPLRLGRHHFSHGQWPVAIRTATDQATMRPARQTAPRIHQITAASGR